MRDFSRIHPKWRDNCLNCPVEEDCVADLPDAVPDKLKCPVYRHECQVQQASRAGKKAANGNVTENKTRRHHDGNGNHRHSKSL